MRKSVSWCTGLTRCATLDGATRLIAQPRGSSTTHLGKRLGMRLGKASHAARSAHSLSEREAAMVHADRLTMTGRRWWEVGEVEDWQMTFGALWDELGFDRCLESVWTADRACCDVALGWAWANPVGWPVWQCQTCVACLAVRLISLPDRVCPRGGCDTPAPLNTGDGAPSLIARTRKSVLKTSSSPSSWSSDPANADSPIISSSRPLQKFGILVTGIEAASAAILSSLTSPRDDASGAAVESETCRRSSLAMDTGDEWQRPSGMCGSGAQASFWIRD